MGVVYKAKDTHLDRFVAIKVLPPEKVADPERKRRFVQEAKAASALNHPNIVHIYDIAEADGIHFIAMEYVPGKTLDQLIGRKGLRLNETLKYAVQLADALELHSASTPPAPRLSQIGSTRARPPQEAHGSAGRPSCSHGSWRWRRRSLPAGRRTIGSSSYRSLVLPQISNSDFHRPQLRVGRPHTITAVWRRSHSRRRP
jgi:hypothetical protein